MGFKIRVEDDDDLFRVMVDGVFTPQVAKQVLETMFCHPGFRPGMTSIWDMRNVQVDMGSGHDAAFASHVRARRTRRGGDYRVAIIADTSDRRATAKIERILTEPWPLDYQIFERYQDADHWLCEVAK